MAKHSRASEDMLDELHRLVTQDLLDRIKSGEASTADLKTAADWLSKNNITGIPIKGSPLSSLANSVLPELDFSHYDGRNN